MCTAVSWVAGDHYFGRNLDLEGSLGEGVAVMPRGYPLRFRGAAGMERHYALLGVAHLAEGYPLYYDAVNEKGLGMAGLNFPGNALCYPWADGKDNVAPFELIPWVLGRCATACEAEACLKRLNLWDEPFSKTLPITPLHWLIADRERAVVLEWGAEGARVYENPVGVLTNNPPFPQQLRGLSRYTGLTADEGRDLFAGQLAVEGDSRGLGAVGLPGDWSSPSRFVRAAFAKLNAVSGAGEGERVSQFFHILKSVEMPRGCVRLAPGVYEITRYSACCNADRGIYYYTTYDGGCIRAVDLFREDLEGAALRYYPLREETEILYQN